MDQPRIVLPCDPPQAILQHSKIVAAWIGSERIHPGRREARGWAFICRAVVARVYALHKRDVEATRTVLGMGWWELSKGGREGEEWTLAARNAKASIDLLKKAVVAAPHTVPSVRLELRWPETAGAAHPGREGVWRFPVD